MSEGFCPDHKAAMVLFLDRVYGIEDQDFLLHLLEVGFLPDLRAAASLDTVIIIIKDFQQLFPLFDGEERKMIFYNLPASLEPSAPFPPGRTGGYHWLVVLINN